MKNYPFTYGMKKMYLCSFIILKFWNDQQIDKDIIVRLCLSVFLKFSGYWVLDTKE